MKKETLDVLVKPKVECGHGLNQLLPKSPKRQKRLPDPRVRKAIATRTTRGRDTLSLLEPNMMPALVE